MELEELKAEAKKLGYNLIPRREYIKKQPCVCGRKKLEYWYYSVNYLDKSTLMTYVQCPKCQRYSPAGRTENEAKQLWNAMIDSIKNEPLMKD